MAQSGPPGSSGTPPPGSTPQEPGELILDSQSVTAPQVLAELELLRRKSGLLERRLVTLEAALEELRKAQGRPRELQLGPTPEDVGELKHRVERLERRREAQAATPAAPATPHRPSPARRGLPVPEDTVALVRARWVPDVSARGESVTLRAHADGIDPGTVVAIDVRSLVDAQVLATLEAPCDGDFVTTTWRIPSDLPHPEIFFEVRHQGALARSPILVLE